MKGENKQELYHTLRRTLFLGCCLLLLFPQICHSSPDSLSIFLNRTSIKFTRDGPPKRYLANKVVSVAIISPFPYWVLQCQGTDLKLKGSKKDEIPAERLFVAVASPGQKQPPPRKDFESLDEVIVVARGGYLGPSPQSIADLYFALKSTWKDKPGKYQGNIIFTYYSETIRRQGV